MIEADAVLAVKRQSALLALYMTDAEIKAQLADYVTVSGSTTTYDVSATAVACLQYVRGIIPQHKAIGQLTLIYEGIDKTIASLNGMGGSSSPGGNIPLTRPVLELGEQEE
jgi:hypothetical protein